MTLLSGAGNSGGPPVGSCGGIWKSDSTEEEEEEEEEDASGVDDDNVDDDVDDGVDADGLCLGGKEEKKDMTAVRMSSKTLKHGD